MQEIVIRKAVIEDASIILEFIKELARYERAEDEVIATVEDIERNLFSDSSTTEALICTCDKAPVGMAVYFLNFSTWLGKNGLYLEDLYVSPKYRSLGAGKKMLKYLAILAIKNDYGRFEWSVLDWNEPAIKFYDAMGAKQQSEWLGYRLEGKSLVSFAKSK